MHDVLDELDYFSCAVLDERFVFDPFGELINSHKNVLETTLGFLKRSYLIQPPTGEWSSGRDANKIVRWDVSLSCKHLVVFALPDEFFCVL
jgi:hypothetical protein